VKEYSNCFVGVPLPECFKEEHKELISKVLGRCRPLSPAYEENPHITLYYLNKQNEKSIEEISEVVRSEIKLLRDVVLKVSGFGYFSEDFPRVMCLCVDAPKPFYKFQKKLSKQLENYHKAEDRAYVPHFTVARIRDTRARKMFEKNKVKLEKLLCKVFWKFPLTAISVYGKANDSDRTHEKLVEVHF